MKNIKVSLTPYELLLAITALDYSVSHYDGESSLGDMADLQEKLETIQNTSPQSD